MLIEQISEEELMLKIDGVCPEMKLNKYLIAIAKQTFCGISAPRLKRRALTHDEYEIYRKLEHEIQTMKVGDLIDYLKRSFKPDDKVCYMDYIEGFKYDCAYVKKNQLGRRFFRYAKPEEYTEGAAVVVI